MNVYVFQSCFRSTEGVAGRPLKSDSRWRTSQPRFTRSSPGFRNAVLLLMALGPVLVMGTAIGQLPGTIDLNVTPGTESSPVLRVYGDDPGDQLGSANSNGIAFGDVNGDGFDDMIVGAWRGDPAGGSHAGEVYVVYGSASLPATTVDLNSDGAISSAGETRILGDDAVDGAGWSVAAGDCKHFFILCHLWRHNRSGG